MSTRIRYVTGDATNPPGTGPRIIAHLCNDIGAWGRGFVMALSRRGPEPETAYRSWYRDRASNGFALGAVQLVPVHDTLWVANMIGQHGIRRAGGTPPILHVALGEALNKVASHALDLGASVHMPRIGTGLAGGNWAHVEPLIVDRLCTRGIDVTVYDLPEENTGPHRAGSRTTLLTTSTT